MKKYNTRKDVPEKYKWDLTDFYKDEEDFENSFKDLQIKTENLKLATAIHKYNHKFEALENAMKNAVKLESKTEFAQEIGIILNEVEETSKNFAKATAVNKLKLPETNIPGIDNMFKYMQEEAIKNNINY